MFIKIFCMEFIILKVMVCWLPKKRHEPVQLFIGGYVGQLEIQLTK